MYCRANQPYSLGRLGRPEKLKVILGHKCGCTRFNSLWGPLQGDFLHRCGSLMRSQSL